MTSTAVGLLVAAVVLPTASASTAPLTGTTGTTGEVTVAPHDAPTTFRIASLNLLGNGHTAPGGNKTGWASGTTRMKWSMKALAQEKVSVAGLQELETPQFTAFKKMNTARTYGWYPGLSEGQKALANTIIWRRDTWRLVEGRLLEVPYFYGDPKPMPYVKLRNLTNGKTIWVYNSHNPASVRGPAKQWRDTGFKREAALVNRLRTKEPTVPVLVTGDKNDTTNYFCQVARSAPLIAPNRAGVLGDRCYTKDIRIDWVLGTPDVTFSTYKVRRDALISKATDHPLVVSTAMLSSEPVADSGIEHVIIVDAEGLTRRAGVHAADGSRLRRLIDGGASTMDARTDPDSLDRLGNVTSILSGRPTDPAYGGTNLTSIGTSTTHKSAGEYVSTIFDKAHNYGRSTAFFASFSEADRIVTSYNRANGGVDPFGYDNGTNKIDTAAINSGDSATVKALRQTLAAKPVDLTYLHLGALAKAGFAHGFRSAAYREALASTDKRLNQIIGAIRRNPEMSGNTMLILTASRGNTRKTSPVTSRSAFRVPLVVWGPGISAGTDLYSLNAGFANPGKVQVDESSVQPIRTGAIANLVDKMFVLPALPGSTIDPTQSMTVLGTTLGK
ncbi:MAG: hypothetical protein ACSLEW_04260 [Nocardioides sp.]